MKRKNLLAFFLTMVLCIAVVGCRPKEDDDKKTPPVIKNEYIITFNYNFGSKPKTKDVKYEEDQVIELIIIDRESYDFLGWFKEPECTTAVASGTTANADVIFYAKWEKQIEKVKLEFDTTDCDGTIPAIEAVAGTVVTIPECTVKKPGYRFESFNDGTNTYLPGDSYTMPATSQKLFIQWVKQYEIAFDLNGATGTTPATLYAEKDQVITLPSMEGITHGDSVFLGWSDGIDLYDGGASYTVKGVNVTFVATWKGTYQASYDLAGGNGIDTAATRYADGTTFTLPPAPLKTDYVFIGWFDGIKSYAAGSEYVMPPYNVEFMAEYEEAITITYVYNHYQKETEVYTVQQAVYQSKLNKPENPTREDHTFVGWYREASCEIEWVFETAKVRENITLYAKWSHKRFTFALNADKQSWTITGHPQNVFYGDRLILPNEYDGKPVTGIADGASASYGAFYNLTIGNTPPLKYIFIPNTYTNIGAYAFNCNMYVTQVEFEAGSQCTRFGEQAFYNMKSLGDINIPETVNYIGDSCFLYCQGLVNVDLSNNTQLKEIPHFGFGRCYSLANIRLPDSIEIIGDAAFNGCESLKEFTIPKKVTEIGRFAFSGSIVPSEGVGTKIDFLTKSLWPDNITASVPLVMQLETVYIHANVTILGVAAFAHCVNLKNIVVDDSSKLKIIENLTFYNCKALEQFEIPASVIALGIGAFRDCDALKAVTVAPQSQLVNIFEYAFANCDNLVDINLPSSVKSLWEGAFFGCNSVTRIVLPEGLEGIGAQAISDCAMLEYIYIPSTVTVLQEFSLSTNPQLTVVAFAPNSQLTMVGKWMFYGCAALETILLPDSIASVDYGSFMYCYNLKNIMVNESNPALKTVDGSLYSKDGKIFYMYALGREGRILTLPEGVTTVSQTAFYDCSSMEELYLPSTLETIGSYGFRYMRSLRKVVFAANSQLKELGAGAFGNNNKFVDDNYTALVIESATLVEVVIPAMIPAVFRIDSLPFIYSTYNEHFAIYVPAEAVKTYQTHALWSIYKDFIKAIPAN